MNNYTTILRAHDLKVTPQRLAISDAIGTYGHINIEELYALMLKEFSSISLATIYKNINIMVQKSFIQEVKIPNAKSVYELTKEAHSHLVCSKCSEVEDITLNVDNIVDIATSKTQFIIKSTDVVFSGICQKCQ